MLDAEVREKFKIFQKSEEGRKYHDLLIDDVRFTKNDIFNDEENIELIGSKKIGSHDELDKLNDVKGLPVYDASANILTYIDKNKFLSEVFTVRDNNNPDISFASEGNSSAGTNFIIHKDSYFINNHRTVIKFSDKYYGKYVYYNLYKMKKKYGFKRGYIPSQKELRRLKIIVPIPIDLDETYTSFKIQEAIVAFLEASFERNARIKENIDKRYELFKRLDKALIPSTFIRDYVKVAFGRYAKEHDIRFSIMDVEFVDMPLSNISKIIKAGGTPKRKIKDYWTSLDNINGYPWLDIDRKEFQLYTINNYREKITEEGLNSSSTWVVPKNSIMITIGGSLGYVALNNIEVCTNQNILNVVLKKEYISKYVMYNLENFYQKNIRSQKSSYGNLSKRSEEVRIIKIPKSVTIYSSNEVQQIISDFIEAMQNKIQKEFDRMDEGYDALKRLHKAYLARTFTLIDWETK